MLACVSCCAVPRCWLLHSKLEQKESNDETNMNDGEKQRKNRLASELGGLLNMSTL